MAYSKSCGALEFIRAHHPIVNLIHVDQLLHDMGLRSAVDKARALATVEVDHVWQGSRYWKTGEIIDAGQTYLASQVAAA